jgi:hypothetical protein
MTLRIASTRNLSMYLVIPNVLCEQVVKFRGKSRNDIVKSTYTNESLHEISNDNVVRVVNFDT